MEGDAGTRQLNPTDADETPDESVAVSTESGVQEGDVVIAPAEDAAGARRPSRLGRGWLLGICAALVVLAAGVAVGGYLALRHHDESEAIARGEAAAVRVKVTNSEAADQEQGYRLRVQMAPVDGTYKIATLDQVSS